MRIYFAAPLFTTGERAFNAALAARLRDGGHEVFLPQAHENSANDPAGIFAKDVAGLEWSDAVVGIMDGADPDSGTSWEIGWAYATGRPIVLLRTDFRTWEDKGAPYNIMLIESASERIELALPTVEAAADAVLAALARIGDRA